MGILSILPTAVQEAILGHATVTGLTEAQILELALASFLDLDAVSFGRTDTYPQLGAVLEENKALRTLLEARGGIPDDAPFDFQSPEILPLPQD